MNVKLFVPLCAAILFACTPSEREKKIPLSQRFDPVTRSYAFTIPNLEPLAGVGSVRAQDCGTCHISIYNEWRASTHATALQDIQFQAELAKADSPKWLCLNCHIPVQNQREYFITHLLDGNIMKPVKVANKKFDSILQKESITCATCHVRRDPKTGASYVIGPIGSALAPHPTRKDSTFLRNICYRCHDPKGEGLTPNLLCWFETRKEMEEGRSAPGAGDMASSDCVTCHMPVVKRALVDSLEGLPIRNSHQHHWTGSGIPKWYQGYETLLERGFKPGLDVKVGALSQTSGGDSLRVRIQLKNSRSGHALPTGDPERFILAIAELRDSQGQSMWEKRMRIGQTWEWNPARKIGDNRLKQGEAFNWQVAMPGPLKMPGAQLSIKVLHVRLTAQNARHMMETQGVNEAYLERGTYLAQNIKDFYPFATFLFVEEIDLTTWKRRKYTPEELIDLSRKEQGRALDARIY